MKTINLLTTLLLTLSLSMNAQSRTLEYVPIFENVNQEYLSEVVEVPLSFDEISFVGISAFNFDSKHSNIQYRVQQRAQWSEWLSFSPQHEMVASSRTAYEGTFITSSFSALQFKADESFTSPLTVRLFVGKSRPGPQKVQKRSEGCDQPDFCNRECWCPDCPIDVTPQYTTTTHIIVHHSAGSNDPNLNFNDVVNYIWDLHVNTNGWDDIGYNWLIDRDGIIYEGRPDGFQGAHFSCINENTVGICLLGNFTNSLPTEEAVNSLVNLAGYEATEHNVDVLGEDYHETGDFNLIGIAGHRDSGGSANACSSTACPGNTFYPMLNDVRGRVADLACYQSIISGIETTRKSDWSVSPNPFVNALTINNASMDRASLEIIDITGKKVALVKANEKQDLSHLERGVYLIMYQGSLVEKVIKQ